MVLQSPIELEVLVTPLITVKLGGLPELWSSKGSGPES